MISCPACGHQVSRKAKACPSCGHPLKKPAKQYGCISGCMIIVLILFIGFIVSTMNAPRRAGNQPRDAGPGFVAVNPPVNAHLAIGDDAALELPGGKGVWLAIDDDAWNKMLDAENSQDMEEIALLMAQDKVVRELNGTKVKVIQSGLTSRKVRIRDGANPGVEAWVQTEFLKPIAIK